MAKLSAQTLVDGLPPSVAFTYPDAANRLANTGRIPATIALAVNKRVRQLDTGVVYIVDQLSPLLFRRDTISEDQGDALVGTSGIPAVGNEYVTTSDPRLTDTPTFAQLTVDNLTLDLNDITSTTNLDIIAGAGLTDRVRFGSQFELEEGYTATSFLAAMPTVVGDRVHLGRINMRGGAGCIIEIDIATENPAPGGKRYRFICTDGFPGGYQLLRPAQRLINYLTSAHDFQLEADVLASNCHFYIRRLAGTAAIDTRVTIRYTGVGDSTNNTAVWVLDAVVIDTIAAPIAIHPLTQTTLTHSTILTDFLEIFADLFLTVDGVARAAAQKPDNIVCVFTEAQLPNTLVAGTEYVICAPLSFGVGEEKTCPSGTVVIRSNSNQFNTITYTGIGTFLSGVGMGSLRLEGVQLIGNKSATLFNLVATGFAAIIMLRCDISGWADIGTVSTFGGGVSLDKVGVSDNDDGFNVIDCVFFGVNNCFFQNFSDSGQDFFTIDALTDRVAITLTGVVAQGTERAININSSFVGEVIIDNVFAIPAGLLFNAAGLNETSIRVKVGSATNQKPSMSIGSYLVNGNAVATTFSGSGVWTDLNLNASAVAASNIERFTLTNTTTGELTYIGIEPFSGEIVYDAYVVSTGGAQDFQMRAVKNGAVLPDTFEPTLNIGTAVNVFAILVPVSLVTGDTVRPQVLRVSGSSTITAVDLSTEVS